MASPAGTLACHYGRPPGYQRGWPWLATNAHVCVYSAQCPDVTQLEILLTVARDDANAVVNMANKARRAARQAACDHDVQACGLREHFRAIKGESVPPVTWVKQPCSSLARLVRSPKGTVRLKLADPSDIPYGSQCRFGTAALLVSEVRGPIVHAQHLSGDIPTTGTFPLIVLSTPRPLMITGIQFGVGTDRSMTGPVKTGMLLITSLMSLQLTLPKLKLNGMTLTSGSPSLRLCPIIRHVVLTAGVLRNSSGCRELR